MKTAYWELTILDADPPVSELGSLATGDIDGDGRLEIMVGGAGHLLWYRPHTCERGIIAEGHCNVGLAVDDIDGDGRLEVVAGLKASDDAPWSLAWFKAPADLAQPWECHIIDRQCNGGAHDIIVDDIDGDGVREIIANAAYCEVPGVYIYKPGEDRTLAWRKHAVVEGIFSEGLGAADLNGDGRIEIVHGPDWFQQPVGGPYAGLWTRSVYAPGFREMSRTALVDITGTGRQDIVIAESEYPDGQLSWFENRLAEDPAAPWIEHNLEKPVNFAHSLGARRDEQSGEVRIFLAEMAAGGWDAPYNWDARVLEYVSADQGRAWQRTDIYRGAGTHQARMVDIDGDDEVEVAGKVWGMARHIPQVHIWKRAEQPSPLAQFRHHFLDRDKPYTGTDILAVDVDGDGQQEVICGAWWYKANEQERREIPGIYQVHAAYDIDGDGRQELIATKKATGAANWYQGLSSELCWLKPVDPANGRWEAYAIGTGTGDWPHGSMVAPILPDGKLALVVGYHSAHAQENSFHYPELFEIPADADALKRPWPKRILADIPYGEELVPCDLNGNGLLDIVAGAWVLENLGDGAFRPHHIVEDFYPARLGVADITGTGKPDIVLGEEVLDYPNRNVPWSRLAWFEQPDEPFTQPWTLRVIDKMRCPHSVAVADLDGDGRPEIVCGEHDPFKPYRSRCNLYVYKQAEPRGLAWKRYVIDDRFEHHDGAKIIEMAPGRLGIMSHGWQDNRYVHLWEPEW